jgi:hypothetical protein
VLSSSSSPSSGSLVPAGAALALTPTGPLSVIGIGIGTFAARGIGGIASGGMLPATYAGGCVMTVRRVPSAGPPAAGTTIGTLGPFGRVVWDPAFGDVRPISVFTGPFAPLGSIFAVVAPTDMGDIGDGGELGEASARPALTLVTDESSSTGFVAAAAALAAAAFPTSSGIVAAGTHSGMPGRHTSVFRGRTLLASAERSSSVRTSR